MARTKQPSNASSRHSSRSSSCRHSKSEKSPRRGLRHRVYALCQACATTRRRGTIIRDRGAIDLDEPLKELDNAAMFFAQTVRLLHFDHATARRSTMPCRPSDGLGPRRQVGRGTPEPRHATRLAHVGKSADFIRRLTLCQPSCSSRPSRQARVLRERALLHVPPTRRGTLARNFPTHSPRIPTTCGLW